MKYKIEVWYKPNCKHQYCLEAENEDGEYEYEKWLDSKQECIDYAKRYFDVEESEINFIYNNN